MQLDKKFAVLNLLIIKCNYAKLDGKLICQELDTVYN